jgi:hypothetical protein
LIQGRLIAPAAQGVKEPDRRRIVGVDERQLKHLGTREQARRIAVDGPDDIDG